MQKTTRKSRKLSISPDEYREFIQTTELMRIYLVEANLKRIRMPNLDSNLTYGQQMGKSKYSITDEGFTATYTFQVTFVEEGQSEPFAKINVKFGADYLTKVKINDSIFEIFGRVNLPLNLHPYIREYVHTNTNRMGIPTLVLPTFKTP